MEFEDDIKRNVTLLSEGIMMLVKKIFADEKYFLYCMPFVIESNIKNGFFQIHNFPSDKDSTEFLRHIVQSCDDDPTYYDVNIKLDDEK